MASLTSQPINTTYSGLLKTNDNAILGISTPSVITDGEGNASALSLAQQRVTLEAGTQKIEVNTTQTFVSGSTVFIQDATTTNFVTTDATTSNIGNATNYLTIDATDASFVGAVDFSTATVTGLPTDTNTTYDLAATQDGVNVDITLTGSDASVDTVQLTAGTNITLTETAGNITIEAAGGGAAGLVAGSALNSMRSADSLTATAAVASGVTSIALGQDSDATGNSSISIGNATNATLQDSIYIGSFGTTAGQKSIGIGNSVTVNGNNSVGIGRLATVSPGVLGGVSIGNQTAVTANGASALGEGVTGDKVNTVSMKALDLQTVSTPTAGGIIMTDAGSTERRLNLTAAGVLQVDSAPVAVENYVYYPWSASGASGYGPTYGRFTQPMNGTGFWNSAVDQNADTGILSQMYTVPGLEINVFVNAFKNVVAGDTYELAVYNTWGDGSPKDKVFTTTVSVIGASGDQYVETAVSFIPTQNRYWFGLQSASGTNSKIGMFPRDQVSNMYGNYGGWGASPVGVSPINSLYYNGGAFPATLPLGEYYNHRDDVLVALYKTV